MPRGNCFSIGKNKNTSLSSFHFIESINNSLFFLYYKNILILSHFFESQKIIHSLFIIDYEFIIINNFLICCNGENIICQSFRDLIATSLNHTQIFHNSRMPRGNCFSIGKNKNTSLSSFHFIESINNSLFYTTKIF